MMNSWLWPLWPLSASESVAIAAAIPLLLLGQAILQTYVLRRQVQRALGGFAERYGPIILTVPGHTRDLWLSCTHLHLYDKLEGALIATVLISEISQLEIIDRSRKSVSFRFRLRGDLETPDVETTAMARFATLFQSLVVQGKQILYFPA